MSIAVPGCAEHFICSQCQRGPNVEDAYLRICCLEKYTIVEEKCNAEDVE